MGQVTIHTYDRQWEGARVIGVGMDTLTGVHACILVRHPDFAADLEFAASGDAEGRHFNVGNSAFWIAALLCPRCSTIVDQADLFCGQCGTNLDETHSPTELLEP